MKIVVASENEGKIKEFRELLEPLNFEIISKKEAGVLDDIEETGKSFIENAIIKAKYVFEKTKLPTIADDSGLEVFSLNNMPGIYSARYSQENADIATDEKNNEKLLKELENKKDRRARYVCALCFINRKGKFKTIVETVNGDIAKTPTGKNGFGYDSLFLYDGVSFGEISSKLKNKISHRAKALRTLLKEIESWIWIFIYLKFMV